MKQSIFTTSLFTLILLIGWSGLASGTSRYFYYTFHREGEGGLARVAVDMADGSLTAPEILRAFPGFGDPHKLAITSDGAYLAGVSQEENTFNLLILALGEDGKSFQVQLPEEPDAIAAAGSAFVVGARSGHIYLVDAASGKVRHTFEARRELTPSGHKAEYITVLEEANQIWVSFQKDSRSGRHLGSRVLLFSITPFRLLHDLQLPRNRPELHMEAIRERGPNPEIIEPMPASNTLLISLDLYGAIALADLDAAERGKWQNLDYLSASPTESWGDAFPDRSAQFSWHGRDYSLITNQGRTGGALLVDLGGREVLQRFEVPHGLEAPILLQPARVLACIVPGKLKWRGAVELEATREPLPAIYLFELPDGESVTPLQVRVVPFEREARRAVAVEPTTSDWILVHTRQDDGDYLTLVDAPKGEILAEQRVEGAMGRLVADPAGRSNR